MTEDLAIVLFARAPVAGQCKSRLARGLGHRRAARLYAALLDHVGEHAARLPAAARYLFCAPDTRHPALRRLSRRHGWLCKRQTRGDLGRRMHHAVAWALARHRRVLLVGSDQPALDGVLDSIAAGCPADDPAPTLALAPTLDGGYWALQLVRPEARLFRGPRWGSPRVARHTCTRATALGWQIDTIEPQRDIDHARDWYRLEPRLRRSIARRANRPAIDRAGPADAGPV